MCMNYSTRSGHAITLTPHHMNYSTRIIDNRQAHYTVYVKHLMLNKVFLPPRSDDIAMLSIGLSKV